MKESFSASSAFYCFALFSLIPHLNIFIFELPLKKCVRVSFYILSEELSTLRRLIIINHHVSICLPLVQMNEQLNFVQLCIRGMAQGIGKIIQWENQKGKIISFNKVSFGLVFLAFSMCTVHTFVCSAVQLYPRWKEGRIFCRSAGVRIIPNFKLNFKFIDYANNLTPTWKKIVNSLFSFVFLSFPSFFLIFWILFIFFIYFSRCFSFPHTHTHTKFLWRIFFPFHSLCFFPTYSTRKVEWKIGEIIQMGKLCVFLSTFPWSDRFSISIISHFDVKTMAAGWICRDAVVIVSRLCICCDWVFTVMARGMGCWLRWGRRKENSWNETHRTNSLHGNNNFQFEDYIKLSFSI